ncbi:MAG: T9SS type A sorting domain-containing protein, partial [Bacteroidales bacterium]|nr:T9SS type A sorting domain-containing protein [Bacteroidales bacterium]
IYFSSLPSATQFSVDPTIKHSGNFSARIEISDSLMIDTAIVAQIINISEYKKYIFEFWIKADSLDQYILPFVKFRNDTNDVFNTYFCPNGNTPGWQKLVARFQVPANSDNVVLFFALFGNGTIWLDDFNLYELTDTGYNDFSVDLNQSEGSFKNLFSSNGIGPGNLLQPYNHIQKFQELGIDYVRTHDFQTAFDYSVIFPDTSQDPLDSTAYNFHTTDSCITDIIDAGGKVFYRFGESAHYPVDNNQPPADMDKFAQVCVQIIKHYNDGWDNGFNYNLDHFEIWNEPDLFDFWSGTINDYIRLYRTTSKKIKQYNPTLKVGGPCVANVFNEGFFKIFLDSAATYNLPIDFISYHFYYHPNPYYFKYVNEYTRQKAESYGLTGLEYYNTEWNSYLFSYDTFSDWGMDDPLNAASLVSAMNYMQNSTIDNFFRYALDNWWFGMVSWDNQWRYSGLAMRSVYQLMNNNIRIEATGSDTLGTTIMASKNNTDDLVQILVADNSSLSSGYNLVFNNIAPGYIYDYEIYRIDSLKKYEWVYSGTITESDSIISQQVESPFTDHIILNKTTRLVFPNRTTNFKIFPNPTMGEINIVFDQPAENPKFLLSNILGEEIFKTEKQFSARKFKIDISSYSNGIYFLNIYTGKEKYGQKIIKN